MNFPYYILAILALATPLIFTTQTTELYEVPKMFFVYTASVLLLFLIFVKFIQEKKLTIPRSPAFLAFCTLTLILVISTLFSIDKFTSIYGYSTRLNGGLLSQLAYLIIFFTGLVTLTKEKSKSIIIFITLGSLAVSLWGIPSHFDKDPTCLLLKKELTSSCWQKDFNPVLRIFSTLGQPNWLASYLTLTIPFAMTLIIILKEKSSKIFFAAVSALSFLALILTNSRSGLLGIFIALIFFFSFMGIKNLKRSTQFLIPLILVFIITSFLFADFITTRVQEVMSQQVSSGTTSTETSAQVAQSPTDSAAIRFIVWKGALEIARSSPILGTGPETFVASYFMKRPIEHNNISEWEFYYNKAHNEFLNYLANTGLLGLASFAVFLLLLFRELLTKDKDEEITLFKKAVASAFLGYIVTIFFGFSTVATQTVFFLAAGGILSNKQDFWQVKLSFLENKTLQKISLFLTALICLYLLTFVGRLFYSNFLEKRAEDTLSPSQELISLRNAVTVSPANNPYLLADFSESISNYLEKIKSEDNKKILKDEAIKNINEAYRLSPNNYIIAQRIAVSYTKILETDITPKNDALLLGKKLTTLAPNYPTAFLTLAKLQAAAEETELAVESAKKAIELKPEYLDAQELLQQLTSDK